MYVWMITNTRTAGQRYLENTTDWCVACDFFFSRASCHLNFLISYWVKFKGTYGLSAIRNCRDITKFVSIIVLCVTLILIRFINSFFCCFFFTKKCFWHFKPSLLKFLSKLTTSDLSLVLFQIKWGINDTRTGFSPFTHKLRRHKKKHNKSSTLISKRWLNKNEITFLWGDRNKEFKED